MQYNSRAMAETGFAQRGPSVGYHLRILFRYQSLSSPIRLRGTHFIHHAEDRLNSDRCRRVLCVICLQSNEAFIDFAN